MKLEVHISSLQSELEAEQILKEECETQVDELSNELENVRFEIEKLKKENITELANIKDRYSKQIKSLERKSETLAAENFELAVEKVYI